MENTPLCVARACLQAYVDKDRTAIEGLIAADYRFSSPLDNELDRAAYFLRCWPNSEHTAGFDFIVEAETADCAFIIYEARTPAGKRFRNCEMYRVTDGRLVSTEVYFGWEIPHPAAPGGFLRSNA